MPRIFEAVELSAWIVGFDSAMEAVQGDPAHRFQAPEGSE